MADTIKYILAALVVGGAIGGFYIYGDQSLLLRVLGLLAAAGIAAAIFFQTTAGRRAWGFVGDANVEVRKVVWPTRKETTQTTLIVMAMAFLIAIVLWVFDMVLMWVVRLLTGQGG